MADRDATCAWNCIREFPHEGPCAVLTEDQLDAKTQACITLIKEDAKHLCSPALHEAAAHMRKLATELVAAKMLGERTGDLLARQHASAIRSSIKEDKMRELLTRIEKYAYEDGAQTPGKTRLSRALAEARTVLGIERK